MDVLDFEVAEPALLARDKVGQRKGRDRAGEHHFDPACRCAARVIKCSQQVTNNQQRGNAKPAARHGVLAHSITSSASESRLSEILTPSARAVLRLITSSNLVGCRTGRSA